MRESPRRLRRKSAQLQLPAGVSGLPEANDGPRLLCRVRVVRRFLAVVVWTLPAVLVQGVCLLLPGRPKVAFARFYWAVFSRLLGLQVRVVGERASGERPVVFIANHSSWVDVPVLGGVLDGCFVAKDEIAHWPLVSTIAKLGRTVFVTRQRGTTRRERDVMHQRLTAGDNLILFPEGTSSDGSRVLPFRTSFFAVTAVNGDVAPLIQPVSVVYDRLGGLPTGRASRPVFAWYGDMDIVTHFWRLGQHTGLHATVVLHAALDPARYPNRKALSQAVWRTVAAGAATLRQNRPARPLGTDETVPVSEPARVLA
jgi:lyso-ornithine lipid O-acyltransferase